ncbi:MAG: glycoside hydrolase family 32 protein [Haloarculaceae archaeon]
MEVGNFHGDRLVNSFHGGDGPTGTLTSPEFEIERDYVNFLVGGGLHPGRTKVTLVVDGKIVRSTTGHNSEFLRQESWDVSEFTGRTARIKLVDEHTGGWGHILADYFVQSDEQAGAKAENLARTISVDEEYVQFPISMDEPRRIMQYRVGGERVRQFQIRLAVENEPDFWAHSDVSEFAGEELTMKLRGMWPVGDALGRAKLSDQRVPEPDALYDEAYRPQFHFSASRGWLNDPNGLVYHDGKWHLFHQWNPFGTVWGNLHWGHAVSEDLVHWEEWGDKLYPGPNGEMWSGSGVVDHANTSGWGDGEDPAMVLFYTAAGGTNLWSRGEQFTQAAAYSNDGGKTITKYDGDPVLKHVVGDNRDPIVRWHEPSQHWIMALWLQDSEFALYRSTDMKDWERTDTVEIPGDAEVPGFFPLALDGDPDERRWVYHGAAGKYLVGSFDGKNFEPESGPYEFIHGPDDYAPQIWTNSPDGRVVQISWMRADVNNYPDMPFNQQLTVPRRLTLRSTDDGPRVFVNPVEELKRLRGESATWSGKELTDEKATVPADSELLDVEATIEPGTASTVALNVRGASVRFSVDDGRLWGLRNSVKLDGETVDLRVLVDRTSIELFVNGGRYQMANVARPNPENTTVAVEARDGSASIDLSAHELESIW